MINTNAFFDKNILWHTDTAKKYYTSTKTCVNQNNTNTKYKQHIKELMFISFIATQLNTIAMNANIRK